MRRVLALSMLLASCAAPGELSVELGTGEAAFETMVGEPTLPLVAGPQGGHHVWISLRVAGASSDRVDLTVDVTRLEAPAPPAREPVRVQLEQREGGDAELVGWPAELVDPGCAIGERVAVRASVRDVDGSHGTDERMIVVGGGTHPPACP
ncbi:MAG: hypothetical protein M5U28_19715 [Sandaracinaceae bacterium]|nr:hypothetical protein [Sandaracinaceae bacterium]